MLDEIIKIFLLTAGLISIGFGLFWAIVFSFQGQMIENLGNAIVLVAAGTISIIIGLKEIIKT